MNCSNEPFDFRHAPHTGAAAFDDARLSQPIVASVWEIDEITIAHLAGIAEPTQVYRPPRAEHQVVFALASANLAVEVAGKHASGIARSGQFCFVPARAESLWSLAPGTELLHLHVPPHLFSDDVDPHDKAHQVLPPALLHTDGGIASLGRACLAELLDPSYGSAVLVRSYVAALAVRLGRALVPQERRDETGPHVISPYRLARAKDFIERNLEQAISVSCIARAAGLSTYHFARGFKRATGFAPYRYLTERRIQRAKAMLRQNNLPICEISLMCGFGSQQQFTTTFRHIVGTTPARWRRGED